MAALLSLLLIITISILLTRVATIALVHTGLSKESARFQARSAFTGVGFTTSESERIVGHPVRRRIVMLMMLIGNAGIVTAVSTLILTFVDPTESGTIVIKVVLLIGGLVGLFALAMSSWVDKQLGHLIDWVLTRYTDLDIRDYAGLLHLAGEYRIAELQVQASDWLANKTLAQLELRDEGVIVLGVHQEGDQYLGTPKGDITLRPGETIIVYGRATALAELDQRRRGWIGEREHDAAVGEQEDIALEERKASSGGSSQPTRTNA